MAFRKTYVFFAKKRYLQYNMDLNMTQQDKALGRNLLSPTSHFEMLRFLIPSTIVK